MSDAIILFSHGSLLCGAGETLRRLAERMRARDDATLVEVGYLNYSEPRFEDACARCVAAGATKIVVAPYFLVAGYFVKVDLPREIEKVRARFPAIEIIVAEPMRFHPALAEAILTCAERAVPPMQWRQLWNTAPEFCRADPQCPLFDSPQCPATGGKIPQHHELPPAHPAPRTPHPALLVMVHGSPRPESNQDMFAVVELVRQRGVLAVVEVGFLECNEPPIAEAIDACVAQGAARVIAVPYFLHAGNHVAGDLPALLEAGQARHPGVEFLMGDYLGHDLLIADVIRDRVAAVR